MHIKGSLQLRDTDIENLPNKLKVDGDLNLYHAKNLKALPDDLWVGGFISMSLSHIGYNKNFYCGKGIVVENIGLSMARHIDENEQIVYNNKLLIHDKISFKNTQTNEIISYECHNKIFRYKNKITGEIISSDYYYKLINEENNFDESKYEQLYSDDIHNIYKATFKLATHRIIEDKDIPENIITLLID